ncbi:MAG: biotin--[acetyl-CoA-carboxylase] ligase [Saccharofermentanales bacterium]|jgi:BirA family biotin operon repressor/biotin-[acetyl-CoA-carboxylase] ligase|nr:biotin--[acetyl-CoA-carboxylase] ligase [Clostridiaceae bacterium]
MKLKILQILKNKQGYASGEQISRQLGVTRTAVWKTVNSLRKEGYPIDAVPNRGYRLVGEPDILSTAEIRIHLQRAGLDRFVGTVAFKQKTDSTNQMARFADGQQPNQVGLFVAEQQTAGRGRRGRNWHSDHKEGLWFSLLIRPKQMSAEHFSCMTLFAGLCVAEALNDLGINTGIKWPNDLIAIASGRKLGGILTEMILEDSDVRSLIVGIGINVAAKKFPEDLTNLATSIFLESGNHFTRAEVLITILHRFAERFPAYGDFRWLADYRSNCLTLGREIKVSPAFGTPWTGRAIHLNDDGELLVEDANGVRHVVRSGEVSIRGLPGCKM